MYALSTCAWCNAAKQFLKDCNVKYEYVDVDLCDRKVKEKIMADISKRGGAVSYPTIIIDDKILITGFRKEEIMEALRI